VICVHTAKYPCFAYCLAEQGKILFLKKTTMKKNLKNFVFEKKGLVTDKEAYDFFGENLNLCTLEELKTKARNYFYDFRAL
jgi:hypothetical protein